MADYNDYQLEEMEKSAVNKSTMAKRAIAGAGLLAAGAATAYGAEQLMDDGHNVATEPVQQSDLASGAAAGAVGEGVTEQPQSQPEPQTVHTEETVHVEVHPAPQPEQEPEMQFETTTHMYDNEGNLVGSVDEGTYDGHHFAVVDQDGDGRADVLWYDENGDGKISQNELADVSDSGYVMGSHGGAHLDYNVDEDRYMADAHEVGGHTDGGDVADIDNDYREDLQNEKSGEVYRDDLAQNNPDYNPKGDVDSYRAGTDEDTLVAKEDAFDGESHGEEYALNDEDSSEYVDGLPYPIDDNRHGLTDDYTDDDFHEDLAYNEDVPNDDIQNDDVDDSAQYDLV